MKISVFIITKNQFCNNETIIYSLLIRNWKQSVTVSLLLRNISNNSTSGFLIIKSISTKYRYILT